MAWRREQRQAELMQQFDLRQRITCVTDELDTFLTTNSDYAVHTFDLES
jgi:hypothetical protein